MEENTNTFMSKAQMLKNLKKNFQNHRMTYKQYMLESHYIEKHYDEMKEEFEKQNSPENNETVNETAPETLVNAALNISGDTTE